VQRSWSKADLFTWFLRQVLICWIQVSHQNLEETKRHPFMEYKSQKRNGSKLKLVINSSLQLLRSVVFKFLRSSLSWCLVVNLSRFSNSLSRKKKWKSGRILRRLITRFRFVRDLTRAVGCLIGSFTLWTQSKFIFCRRQVKCGKRSQYHKWHKFYLELTYCPKVELMILQECSWCPLLICSEENRKRYGKQSRILHLRPSLQS